MNITTRIQLIDLVKRLHLPVTVAEVGVAEGRFTKEILSQGIEHLYIIDRWQSVSTQKGDGSFPQEWHENNYRQVLDTVATWDKDTYTILKMDSVEATTHIPDSSLGLVYLDADHSYEGFLRDISAYYSKVCKGGIIAGHDVLNNDYGVGKGLHEFCTAHNITYSIIPENEPNSASFYFIKP